MIILAIALTLWAILRKYAKKPPKRQYTQSYSNLPVLSPAEIQRRERERERARREAEKAEEKRKRELAEEREKFLKLYNKLEGYCYSRLNNDLTPRQKINLENRIQNAKFEIDQFLREVPRERATIFRNQVADLMVGYEKDKQIKDLEDERNAHVSNHAKNSFRERPRKATADD